MASFASVSNAVACAIAIQQAFSSYDRESPDAPLYVRIGLSAGEPIEEHGDFYGRAVQLAARLCAQAEPAAILASQIIVDQCHGKPPPFSDMGDVTPKGFGSAVRVYEVGWREAT